MLICTVRDCRAALVRDQNKLACSRGHSFDTARSGYINLLQPQDRRSKNPGDSAEAVAARRRLHDKGVTEPLLQAIGELAQLQTNDVVLDAGCGDGYHLGMLQKQIGFDAHGVDISVPAIDAAARRYMDCEWIVANADRLVPYTEKTFSFVMSITARMNAPEFRRVLKEDGRLLIAVPAPDDLIELRGSGDNSGRDRAERTLTEFSEKFRLIKNHRATTQAYLDANSVQDVLLSIYRPMRSQPVEAMRLTFSLDLLLFAAG